MSSNSKFRTGFLSEMRRYPGEGWISGVCAGIADYFDWKLKLVRLIVALLAIFTAGWVVILLYILAWYLMDNGDEMPGPRPKWNDGGPAPSTPYSGPSGGAAATTDLREIKERFARLDERLRRMEETALSKDDALKREIEKLERDEKS
jgi:phage shock protein C